MYSWKIEEIGEKKGRKSDWRQSGGRKQLKEVPGGEMITSNVSFTALVVSTGRAADDIS